MLAVFGVGQVLWSILWFFVFLTWIMLLFNVFGDIFRSPDLGGAAKVVWLVLVIAFPYLGVFAYLITRGGGMAERQMAVAQRNEAMVRSYIADAAGSSSAADQLSRLGELKEKGLIDDAEFAAAKARVLA